MEHASPSTTLNIHADMFDEARHAPDIRARIARSAFAGLLEANEDDQRLITLPAVARSTVGPLSARERGAIKWATSPNLDQAQSSTVERVSCAAESTRFAATTRWS